MHRKHHQSLHTVGGTGQQPAMEEPDVRPDVWSIPKRCQSPGRGHPPDVSPPSPAPDVGGPKRRRLGAPSAPDPEVGGAPKHPLASADPDVGTRVGLLHPSDPQKVVAADVQHLAVSKAGVGAKGPNPDVEAPENRAWVLMVDSDTDAEDEEPHPDVGAPQSGRGALEDPDPDVKLEPPRPALGTPCDGPQLLVVDSDTDVEEEGAHPDVGPPESPNAAPRGPDVKAEPPNGVAGGRWALLVESDTDVEEDASDPDVWPPKPPRDLPQNPDVGPGNPNPHGQRPQAKRRRLLVESDTDVEEDEGGPDVERAQMQLLCRKERVLVMETPKPDVEEPQGVATDTDGEDEDLTQCVLQPSAPQQHPTVVLESPIPKEGTMRKPDVVALPSDPAVSPCSSDTDMEEVAPTPDVRGRRSHSQFQTFPHPDVVGIGAEVAPNSWKAAPKSRSNEGMSPSHDTVNPDPDVAAPNPDVTDPDVVVPSTDLKAPNPDVTPPSPGVRIPNPDVMPPSPDARVPNADVTAPNPEVTAPNPDVSTPNPDVTVPNPPVEAPCPDVVVPNPPVEAPCPDVMVPNPPVEAPCLDVVVPNPPVAAPSPDVRIPDPDVSTPNPPVAAPSPDVKAPNPDVTLPSPDMKIPNPDVSTPNPAVNTPNLHESPPNPATVAPDPDVGSQGHSEKTLAPVPAAPMDASTPKSQPLDSSSGVTSGADGSGSDSDDVDLFLEPTQSFLPPADKGSPQGWDPEELTQLFCPPQEEGEEPPQAPPQATITPPKERTKEEGPRRSQRLAKSRRGGAKGGVASDEVGGAPLGPAPLRRSPRLLARPLAPPEPRPPPAKPRPRRAGTGQSRRRVQEKEEEPIEVEAPQLRSRRSRGSSPLKVLFTGVVASEAMEVALRSLGGSVATSVFDCTHLVTDRVRRTIKFLCAVARGIPIVTPQWLHKSATSGRVLATGPFLVQDRQQERHFGFSLAQALQRARRHPLLQGYEIHVTPSVRPEPEHMKDIITCSGGTFLPTMPSTYRPRRVVVSCPADAWCWAPALSSRLPLASPELLLTGLLRQRLQLQPFLLRPH